MLNFQFVNKLDSQPITVKALTMRDAMRIAAIQLHTNIVNLVFLGVRG